jgi:hypothetical protein
MGVAATDCKKLDTFFLSLYILVSLTDISDRLYVLLISPSKKRRNFVKKVSAST